VDFTYPNSEIKALDGLNVKISQGEKIAIVGPNGSGKSTFVNLLCGLYSPAEGSVTLDGEEIMQNLSKVRHTLSVIFQNFCQYQDSVRYNFTVSDPERAGDSNAILELAWRTGAYEVIKNQENALDEIIGIFSEEGINLSGGQWQKIAITRAMFRESARVYILDEPTAALDPIAEANIYRNFASLTGDKTTILVSHRLGVTKVVDRILVFDKGKIVEDGSHEELMVKNGLYSRMYNAQADWYK
jgi:ABC-type multidrug transport system fused ATPase/permease subunit